MLLLGLFTLILGVSSTVITDGGCSCATVPNGTTPLGCSAKLDWTGQTSKWCMTAASCGKFQTGFGYVDSCSQAGFPSVTINPPTYLEWDQAPYTFYTGQTLTVNWTAQNIASSEFLKIAYSKSTLTTGSGVNVTAGGYSVRISDSGTSVATGVPVTVSSITSPAVTANSTLISVLQSKISYVNVYDGPTLVATGGSIVADGRNVTIQWRGLGEAGMGVASVTVKSSFGGGGGGGGTTVGTAVTGLVAQGNMTVNYTFPRGAGSGFGTYTAQVSVQSPGTGVAPYTLSSSSFSVAVAPSQTPTTTPSSSATPTPSLSFGASASITPSRTPTLSVSGFTSPSSPPSVSGTPSQTAMGTLTVTATPTPTPTTPPDFAAMAAAASQQSVNLVSAVVGGVVGGLVFMGLVGFIVHKLHQRRLLHAKRLRRFGAARARVNERETIYGVNNTYTPQRPSHDLRVYRSNSSKMSSV